MLDDGTVPESRKAVRRTPAERVAVVIVADGCKATIWNGEGQCAEFYCDSGGSGWAIAFP